MVAVLQSVGFGPPKWTYRDHVPIRELALCSRRRLECDVVAYRDGQPVVVFELDGHHHVEEKQAKFDEQKEKILRLHGVRLWRMWNGELLLIEGEARRVFRRHVKAHFYAPHGTLACDWRKLCETCRPEV